MLTKIKKKWKKYMMLAFISIISVIIFSHFITGQITKPYLYDDLEIIPHNKVGLLLGTTKRLNNQQINLFYLYRIEAAVNLYKAGKIDFILASGDNSVKEYDEPSDMKADLVKKGVPEEKIYLDYAGFRTLDSVVRSKAIFGQNSITIISQPFHNERAVFISKWKDINAIAYNAKTVSRKFGMKVFIRERLARVKMFLDLFLGKEPKFYGEQIEIK